MPKRRATKKNSDSSDSDRSPSSTRGRRSPRARAAASPSPRARRRASPGSSSGDSPSPRVTGAIAVHRPHRTSPERASGLEAVMGALTLGRRRREGSNSPSRTRAMLSAPVCRMTPEEIRTDSFRKVFFGAQNAAVRALAEQPSNCRVTIVPPVSPVAQLVAAMAPMAPMAPMVPMAALGPVLPQPNPGETAAQFRRRLQAEAAEKRIAKKGGRR